MGERLDAGMLSRDLHIYLVFLICAFFMESTITLRSGQACTYLVYLLEQAKILTKIGQVKKSMCLTTFKAFSFCRQFRLRQFGPLLLCSLRYTCRWQLEQKLLHECYVFPCNENFTILTSYFINFFFYLLFFIIFHFIFHCIFFLNLFFFLPFFNYYVFAFGGKIACECLSMFRVKITIIGASNTTVIFLRLFLSHNNCCCLATFRMDHLCFSSQLLSIYVSSLPPYSSTSALLHHCVMVNFKILTM